MSNPPTTPAATARGPLVEPQPEKAAQWQKLFHYILGNQAAWIVDIGLKAGLFSAIAAESAGIDEARLAQTLGYQDRYVSVWCRAAYAFELLDWDERSGYRLAPHLQSLLLDPSDAQFIGGRIQFYTALYEDFRAFPAYLVSGETWPRSCHQPELLEFLAATTRPDAVVMTEHVLPQAPEALARLDAGGAILDLGAGAGQHVIHYARRFPRARVIGVELDARSVDLARRNVAAAGLEGRVIIRQGDANALQEEVAYDLVTLNIALHETGGAPEYRNVLARVRRALTPGGSVVVAELPYPDSPAAYRDSSVYKALAGVQLHEALVGCGMITQGELGQLLQAAGFARTRIAQQPLPTRFVMIGNAPD